MNMNPNMIPIGIAMYQRCITPRCVSVSVNARKIAITNIGSIISSSAKITSSITAMVNVNPNTFEVFMSISGSSPQYNAIGMPNNISHHWTGIDRAYATLLMTSMSVSNMATIAATDKCPFHDIYPTFTVRLYAHFLPRRYSYV